MDLRHRCRLCRAKTCAPAWRFWPNLAKFKEMRHSLVFAATALLVLMVLAACASSKTDAPGTPVMRAAVGCDVGQAPCGNGCRPAGTVCCDDGTGVTSSFCTGGLGCFKNGTRSCAANGAASAYCCGATGAAGSGDCPPAQHHCGDACIPIDTPCCSGSACPSQTTGGDTACATGVVLCGVCAREAVCHACPSGACCSGDVCSNVCVKGDACTVPSAPPVVCSATADCGNGQVCVSARRCQAGDGGGPCACNGDTAGSCVDFASRNLSVSACGTCTADYSACCAGTMCVDGVCKASCP